MAFKLFKGKCYPLGCISGRWQY